MPHSSRRLFSLVMQKISKNSHKWACWQVPSEQRFFPCMAFSVYEVVRVGCLSRSWFVYSLWETNYATDKPCEWLKPSFQKSGRSQTIRDFTFCRPSQIYRIIATSLSQILPINLTGNGKCAKNWNLRDRETGAQQFRGLVMSEIHRRRPRRYKFEFSFVGNDRRPSQKSGTRRENRNTPDSPDLSPSIPDDRGYLRFRVFICRKNLRQSGNSKISDRLGFSRHLKTRL